MSADRLRDDSFSMPRCARRSTLRRSTFDARWSPSKRFTHSCPFEEKNEAKRLGAKWDPSGKVWYVTDNMKPEPFKSSNLKVWFAIIA